MNEKMISKSGEPLERKHHNRTDAIKHTEVGLCDYKRVGAGINDTGNQ